MMLMKIKIKTKKPEEIEAGLKFVKENLKEHTSVLGKWLVTINVNYKKLSKDTFEIDIDYASKIPIMTDVIDWRIKNMFWKELQSVDSEVKEI